MLHVPPKRQLIFSGIHGSISQKMQLLEMFTFASIDIAYMPLSSFALRKAPYIGQFAAFITPDLNLPY
jgi:hypothetical protein